MLAELQHRMRLPEIMDEPDLDPPRHVHALQGLARLNRWSRSAATLWSVISRLATPQHRPLRVLDVACGGGDVLIGIARRARRTGLRIECVGCDISAVAVQHAERAANTSGVDAEFRRLDAVREALPSGFDCIFSSLFLHHLDQVQAAELLRKLSDSTSSSIVVYDLVRCRTGLLLTQIATRLLTRSDVVHTDGVRSVRAAFDVAEVHALAVEAGLDDAVVTRCWPCRFLVTWKRPA